MEPIKLRKFENEEVVKQYIKRIAEIHERWCASAPVIVINNQEYEDIKH